MIIDCHTHIGRNEHIRATAKELLDSMDKSGIDKSLVFAGDLNDCPNEWMLEQIAPHRDRLLGVAAIHPMRLKFGKLAPMSELQDESKRLTDLYAAGKIVACKFYTGYDHYFPQDKCIEDFLMDLEDVGCPAIFHCGDCLNSVKKAKLKYAHPLGVDDVAVDYPDMNFIIAHMGYPWQRDAAEVCYKNDNVYSDISGYVYGEFSESDKIKFKQTISEFLSISSADKLLFGTDWPISNQKSYIKTLDWLEQDLSAQTLTNNIKKAFNLK